MSIELTDYSPLSQFIKHLLGYFSAVYERWLPPDDSYPGNEPYIITVDHISTNMVASCNAYSTQLQVTMYEDPNCCENPGGLGAFDLLLNNICLQFVGRTGKLQVNNCIRKNSYPVGSQEVNAMAITIQMEYVIWP